MLAAMLLLTVPLGCTKEPIKPIENPDRVDTVPNPKPDTIPDPKPNPNPQPRPSPDPGKVGAVDSIMVDAYHFDSWVYISPERKGNARVVGKGSMTVDGERRVVMAAHREKVSAQWPEPRRRTLLKLPRYQHRRHS